MEILEKILGNGARVKLMKLFLLNKGKGFESRDIARRSRVSPRVVSRELRVLSSVGFIKKKSRTASEWFLNTAFKYHKAFEDLLVRSDNLSSEAILNNFKKVGKVKFVVVAGVFIKNEDSRIDLLIVGDNLKRGRIEAGIRRLEAEIGTELAYSIFETKEFLYRLSMYDKLVRDILDFPHKVLLQTKDLSTQILEMA